MLGRVSQLFSLFADNVVSSRHILFYMHQQPMDRVLKNHDLKKIKVIFKIFMACWQQWLSKGNFLLLDYVLHNCSPHTTVQYIIQSDNKTMSQLQFTIVGYYLHVQITVTARNNSSLLLTGNYPLPQGTKTEDTSVKLE